MNIEKSEFYYTMGLAKWSFIISFVVYFVVLNLTTIFHKIMQYKPVGCYGNESVNVLEFDTVFHGIIILLNDIFPYLGDLFWVTTLSLWLSIIYTFVFGVLGVMVDIHRNHSREIENKLPLINLTKSNKINLKGLFQSSELVFLFAFTVISTFLNVLFSVWPDSVIILVYVLDFLGGARLMNFTDQLEIMVPLFGWFFGLMLLSFCLSIGLVFLIGLIKLLMKLQNRENR